MNFVIFDTEYVADKGLFEEGFEGWKNREIIQIAALKVNDSLEVVDSLNLYVKPTKHKNISPYFSQLTGITDDIINQQGIDFPQAYEEFKSFVMNCDCYSHAWSFNDINDGDGEVLRETMSYYGINNDNPPSYHNIAYWFREQYQKKHINISKQSSGEIAQLLGQEKELERLNLNPHNALYDVYSILIGLKCLGFKR